MSKDRAKKSMEIFEMEKNNDLEGSESNSLRSKICSTTTNVYMSNFSLDL